MGDAAWDLVVVGAGSGGIGAAVAAARLGCRTLLLEAAAEIGGNVVRGGVHSWEPVAGATGLPAELYHRARPDGAWGVSCTHRYHPDAPYGLWLGDPRVTYADSLRRSGLPSQAWHALTFEPEAYQRCAGALLAEAGVTVGLGRPVVDVEVTARRITALAVGGADPRRVPARCVVDATAGLALCRRLGLALRHGEDPQSLFGEASAPEQPSGRLNAVSLLYRVRPRGDGPEPLPAGTVEPWRASAHIVESPTRARTINPLPTLEGEDARALGPERAYAECRRRIDGHWHWLQREHGYADWERFWIAPALGVREGPRLVGRATLTEHDLDAGLPGQDHDDIVCLADHAKDTHGRGGGCNELAAPYGVPYRCLLPADGPANLAVACRGASFSHLAASSCRLSRTMMQLGQAAGTAAAVARRLGVDLPEVPPAMLRQRLIEQGVQLHWDGWQDDSGRIGPLDGGPSQQAGERS